MRRILLRVAAVLAGVVLIVGGAAWWALSSEAGARWAFGRLGALLKGSFRAERVSGSIRGPLTVFGIVYESDGMTVTVRRLEVEWRLSKLLSRQLDIVRLAADGIRVRTVAETTKRNREKLPDVHLPVNVIVRQATVRDIQLAGAQPGAKPLVLDAIDLATSAVAETIRIDRLSVRSPIFQANASGKVRPQGDYPVDVRLDWSASPPDSPRYAGSGVFSGTLEKLLVRHHLDAPFLADVDATLTSPLRDLRFDLDARFRRVTTTAFAPTGPVAELSGRARARGSLDDFAADGDLDARVETNELGPVRARFAVERHRQRWRVRRLELRFPGTPTVLAAQGTAVLEPRGPRLDLTIGWTRIAWPLRGDAIARSARGEARFTGTLDAYAVSLAADVSARGLPESPWRFQGRGDRSALRVESFAGAVLGGEISGSGRFAWKPQIGWTLDVRGSDLDPGRIARDYPGKLRFAAQSEGRLARGGPIARIEVSELSGILRGQLVDATARVDLDHARIFVRRGEATVGSARLTVVGEAGPTLGLQWTARIGNVGALVADAAGSLSGRGTLSGPRAEPRVQAVLSGEGLASGGRRVRRLNLDLDVDLGREAPSRLEAKAEGVLLGAGQRAIDSVTVSGRGTRSEHRLTVSADGTDDKLDLAVAGGLSGRAWRGQISRLDLRSRIAGNWSLAGAASLEASGQRASLRGFCWTSSGGKLCVDGAWEHAGESVAHAALTNLPLALLSPWLPRDAKITGRLDGRVDARISGGGVLVADVSLAPQPGELAYAPEGGQLRSFPYRNASFEFHSRPVGATARAGFELDGVGRLAATLELPRYNERGVAAKSQPLRGKLDADFRDLAFLGVFLTSVEQIGGAARADLVLSGSLGDPRARGEVAVTGARAELPQAGVKLRDIGLRAASDGSGPIRIDVSARSGDGTLTLSGESPLAPTAASPARLKLSGKRFEAMNTPDRHVLVSPELTVTATADRVQVDGDVTVPETRIEYQKKFATVPLSGDVVFVGAKPQADAVKTSRQIVARVRLVLGDQVRLKAMGFDGKLAGSLLAVEEPGRPTAGTGALTITEGTYKAYGQDLTVERGRIAFAGPIDNPALDLRAFRKADDGTVAGVNVKGTLRNPELTVYSDPAMSQTDALAYLLLGHPLGAQASKSEGSLVANAAASLGVAGGNLLGKKLAKKYGLEVAKIQTEGSLQEASLVVGKYLSPKLYVEYGMGIFDRISTLRVNYVLSRKWTVRADTGSQNGADILYTIER